MMRDELEQELDLFADALRRSERARKPAEALGVSAHLPPRAVEFLVEAAERARQLPEGSLQRRAVVDEAAERVRKAWPHLFRW